MPDPALAAFSASLDGELLTPGSPGYDAIRRPAFREVRPRLVVLCRSVSDVAATMAYAAATGHRLTPRNGGHCFAGRSTTDGIVLDVSGLDRISVSEDGTATIGAGARLEQVYAALHTQARTLPAGCGPTVGITGLTLGGGIGLLGRKHGLTCDRLVGAQAVLPGGRVVECDTRHEPDLFWALRGAGGGQFGVVTSLRFATVAEPDVIPIEGHRHGTAARDLAAAWQTWAPDLPDDITVNLTLDSVPGTADVRARLVGASALGPAATREALRHLAPEIDLRPGVPYHRLKGTLAGPDSREVRIRSEFFVRPMSSRTLTSLLTLLTEPRSAGHRQLTFTAMGGAYNRVAEDATAFAHRGERFLLEHIAHADDPWIDRSWATAHPDASGRVYPNFPDPALDDWAPAYHAGNRTRLAAVKHAYDPHRFLDFPQAI
ncbi:FAD-binding oxidoreductase [Nonomuraea soli]|uniref:FAD/FMN-containing dehydrogenase n=1 Tax=Nonomuraea soli TaxID=1032476 RepID=A0A7W0CKW2_9ACTN|nr:FAD-binding oxidoreductase [Nonomuraea soli]MBA2892847.1 FAD/FMN-containing dehydrogenase [Nonomuraea soli]